jgi:hypothetical protein
MLDQTTKEQISFYRRQSRFLIKPPSQNVDEGIDDEPYGQLLRDAFHYALRSCVVLNNLSQYEPYLGYCHSSRTSAYKGAKDIPVFTRMFKHH